jgi:hypothetical protein
MSVKSITLYIKANRKIYDNLCHKTLFQFQTSPQFTRICKSSTNFNTHNTDTTATLLHRARCTLTHMENGTKFVLEVIYLQ